MSATIETIIHCDGPRKGTKCPRDGAPLCSADSREQSAKKQRKYAKEIGWFQRGGLDYCPDCAKTLQMHGMSGTVNDFEIPKEGYMNGNIELQEDGGTKIYQCSSCGDINDDDELATDQNGKTGTTCETCCPSCGSWMDDDNIVYLGEVGSVRQPG